MRELGASMVKWVKIVLWYIKTIIFLVKSSSKVLLKLDFFFHDDICFRVNYSNVEHEVEIFNTYH